MIQMGASMEDVLGKVNEAKKGLKRTLMKQVQNSKRHRESGCD